MVKNKIWYEIYGTNNNEETLLAKVKSKGLSYILAEKLKEIYKNVRIQ